MGKGIDAALEEVAVQSGKQFDPLVVAAALEIFKDDGYQFPPLL